MNDYKRLQLIPGSYGASVQSTDGEAARAAAERYERAHPRAIGVRGVLAGAYRGRSFERFGGLTHAVALDWRGAETHVLCKIPFDNLCDLAESGAPTCPACARRAAK
jgi:hypothetical protein